jgi:hypothetical protein
MVIERDFFQVCSLTEYVDMMLNFILQNPCLICILVCREGIMGRYENTLHISFCEKQTND